MWMRGAVSVLAIALTVTGCAGSSGGPSAQSSAGPTTSSPESTSPSTSPAPVLAGTQSVDISWSVAPEIDVKCPHGLQGFCTHVTGSGYDDTLGALSLDEYLATPKEDSCSTGAVEGTFAMTDQAESSMAYSGRGRFCWSSLTGAFHLTLGKGTDQLEGATGRLTAKITNATSVADEWTGSIRFNA